MKLPPLTALRAFEATARLSSFTAAAAELHVTQGAISHQIRVLEEELGTTLFHRVARRVVLTEIGRSLSAELTEGFRTIVSAVETVRAKRDPNEVRMIFPPNLSARWLVPRLPRFQCDHPQITLTLFHSNRPETIGDDVDVTISWCLQRPHGLTDRLMGLSCAPMCTPALKAEHAVASIAQVGDCQLLETPFCRWKDWFAAADVTCGPTVPRVSLDNFNVLINSVLNGQGIGLCPTAFTQDYISEGRLVFLSDVTTHTSESFFLACTQRSFNRAAVRQVRLWLLSQAKVM
jgi:LysR family transcriptional regulator, glycine cleavage system transcriptional activator